MLQLTDICSGYGTSQALFGVSIRVDSGQVVALLGRNGMGKTTTIRTIMGLTPAWQGTILWNGQAIETRQPYEIARLGLGLVPEGRQIFPTLTVRENLLVAAANRGNLARPYDLDRILSIFPRLRERLEHRGMSLSGGEQQMLAIGRALMTGPRLLLLDEATEGLAPMVCEEIWQGLTILKRRGLSILVVDKKIDTLLSISDQVYILEKGKIVRQDRYPFAGLTPEIRNRYLGI